MKVKNRLITIKQLLLNEKKVSVADLSGKFSVTEETIRRDLEKLETDGFVTRTYGGAVLNGEEVTSSIHFFKRAERHLDLKQKIAVKTLELLKNKSAIAADSSSTVLEALKLLKSRDDLTVFTNSTEVLRELLLSSVKVMSTGGVFNKQSLSLQGTLAEQAIANYNVEATLISCKGLDIEKGVTDSNENEAKVKKIMISQSAEVILLADSTKFDSKAFVHLADMSRVTTVITDAKPEDKWIDFFNSNNIELIY